MKKANLKMDNVLYVLPVLRFPPPPPLRILENSIKTYSRFYTVTLFPFFCQYRLTSHSKQYWQVPTYYGIPKVNLGLQHLYNCVIYILSGQKTEFKVGNSILLGIFFHKLDLTTSTDSKHSMFSRLIIRFPFSVECFGSTTIAMLFKTKH